MPLQTREAALTPDLLLPPAYSVVRLRELGDAFAHAISLAPEHGAGTLVYVGRFDLAEFALVIEPQESLTRARRTFYAGMAALADALAAIAPPETAINIEWPDRLYVNWGLVGGGRLAWPKNTSDDQFPPWLVFGATIRTASMAGLEPGATPDVTALDEEGFSEINAAQVIESFARNFMQIVNAWDDGGFGTVAKSYFGRFSGESGPRRDIDDRGDLLIHRTGAVDPERFALLPRLAQPSWLHPSEEGPRI